MLSVSAVIYAAIVVIWLLVLVPMWLRRHDAAADERSSERFEGAMRVLARRPSAGSADRRYTVRPRRSAATPVHQSTVGHGSRRVLFGPDRRPVTADLLAPPPSAAVRARAASSSAVARRRRTLLVLVGLTVVALAAAVLGVAPWPAQLLPELLLAGFVVHLRQQAKQAAVASPQRRRGASPRRNAPPAPARTNTTRHTTASWLTDEEAAVTAQPSPYDLDGALQDAAAAEPISRTWQPTPVPPPTYTMKPPAPPLDPALLDEFEPEDEGDLDAILERDYNVSFDDRRAVND